MADAIAILRIVVGLDPPNALADCDGDGSTGIADAIAVLRCVVSVDPWPINGGEPQLGDEKAGPDGQTLVWVPGGSFMMGSNLGGYDNQRPIHKVTLDGFWIGKYEVTTTEFAAFLNQADPADLSQWIDIGDGPHIEAVGGTYQPLAGWASHPACEITWYGAAAYCDHYGYALPTEAQWEYAARGPEALEYPWGDEWNAANCCYAGNRGPWNTTFEVGSFPDGASWCTALDMTGSIREWCSDWYGANYYDVSPELNPPGPATGDRKVMRGGAWADSNSICHAAYRWQNFTEPTAAYGSYGFRVVEAAEGG